MYFALARIAERSFRKVESFDDLRSYWDAPDARFWIDLEQPSADELAALDSLIDLSDAALEDCLHGDQSPRLDEFDDYVFAMLSGAFDLGGDGQFEPKKLAVFCGGRYLVTVHRTPLSVISQLREKSDKHPEQVMRNGPDALFCLIVGKMVENLSRSAQRFQARLEELEEESLTNTSSVEVLKEVAALRRDLLSIRRVAAAQRDQLEPLALGEYDYVSESLGRQFDRERSHLDDAVQQIDSMRERLRGVVDNYRAWVAVQTNEIMRRMTILGTIMLPLSLIAGFFGMNVPLGAIGTNPASVWLILSGMAALVSVMLYYFRRRHWI